MKKLLLTVLLVVEFVSVAFAKENLLELVCEKSSKNSVEAKINLLDSKAAELILNEAGVITRCPLSLAAVFDKRLSQTFSATVVLDKNTQCEATTKLENEIEDPIKIMLYFKGDKKPKSARVFWQQNNGGPECLIKKIDLQKMKLD